MVYALSHAKLQIQTRSFITTEVVNKAQENGHKYTYTIFLKRLCNFLKLLGTWGVNCAFFAADEHI